MTVRAARAGAAVVVALALGFVGGCAPGGDADGYSTGGDADGYASGIVAETNRVRAARGLAALTPSACAGEHAQTRAAALVGAATLTHADLVPVIDACAPQGSAAENLSRSSAAPADVVAAWLASPGHANNLLSDDLTHLAVACVPDAGDLLCSQIFLG